MELNPLDWTAGPFLTLYMFVAGVALVIALLLAFNPGGVGPDDTGPDLGVLELAFLAGGPARAADTVLVGLLTAGAATLEGKRQTLHVAAARARLPRELEPFRHAVDGPTSRSGFHAAVSAILASLQDRLAERGLAPQVHQRARLQRIIMAVLAAPVVLGVAKICVGMSRNRPVGILVVLVCLTVAVGGLIIRHVSYRTAAGAAALASGRSRHARASRAPLDQEVALAFAITGVAALAGTPYAAFARHIKSSDGGDGGGGSSDGGGGGGGCGGCGGGH